MWSRARSYARTQRPGRVEFALRGAALWTLVLGIWLVQGAAFARSSQLYVRLPADMPAATAQRLISALEAQLADLTSIDLSEPAAEQALGIVSIALLANALSLQFADARAEAIGAPRVVNGAPGERSASEVASIVRAFVVARLEHERAEAAANAAAAQAAAARATTSAQTAAQTTPAATAPARTATAPSRKPPSTAQSKQARTEAGAALLAAPAAHGEPDNAAGARATVLPDADVHAPAASQAESWRLRLAAGYTGSTYAPELAWLDGLRVDVSARLKSLFYLGASYSYQPPADVNDPVAPLRVTAHTLHTFFGLGRTWRSFGAALDLGLGAMRTLRSTGQVAETLERTPDEGYWNMLAVLRVHGRVRFPALPRLALDVAPALELAPGARQALAREDGGERVVLSPALVRARVDVGASFDVF